MRMKQKMKMRLKMDEMRGRMEGGQTRFWKGATILGPQTATDQSAAPPAVPSSSSISSSVMRTKTDAIS